VWVIIPKVIDSVTVGMVTHKLTDLAFWDPKSTEILAGSPGQIFLLNASLPGVWEG
jgi:hypothetical protein